MDTNLALAGNLAGSRAWWVHQNSALRGHREHHMLSEPQERLTYVLYVDPPLTSMLCGPVTLYLQRPGWNRKLLRISRCRQQSINPAPRAFWSRPRVTAQVVRLGSWPRASFRKYLIAGRLGKQSNAKQSRDCKHCSPWLISSGNTMSLTAELEEVRVISSGELMWAGYRTCWGLGGLQ
jgi:hypothetical protein